MGKILGWIFKNTMQVCGLDEFGTGEGQVWAVVNTIMNFQAP